MSTTNLLVFGSWEICGRRLRAVRRAAGLTQAEVAEAICVTKQTYGRYEAAGLRPPIDKFAGIVIALHARLPEISADHILFGGTVVGEPTREVLIDGVRYRPTDGPET